MMRIGSIGVTEKSVWLEQRRPLAKADCIGLMKLARFSPRLAMCSSPQKKVCSVKKLGEKPSSA